MPVFRLTRQVEPILSCPSVLEQAAIMERAQHMFSTDRLSLDGRIHEHRFDAAGPERLPWPIAVPLIGGLSVGLWFGLWKLAVFALHG